MEDLTQARSEIQSEYLSTETSKIWETVFICAKEFHWSAHYTLNEVPVYWLRKILDELGEYAKAQNAAAHGHQYEKEVRLPEAEKERRNRLLAELEGLNYDEIRSNRIFG